MTAFDLLVPAGAQDAVVDSSATGIAKQGTVGSLLYDRTGLLLQPPADAHLITSGFADLHAALPTAVAACGISWVATCPALPPAGAFVYLGTWGGATSFYRIGDIRINELGQPSARDYNTVATAATTFVLVPLMPYRIYVKCVVGSTTGHQVQLFVGSNLYGTTPDWDSGLFSATGQTVNTLVSYFLVGQAQGTNAVDVRIGRLRYSNDGTDPGSGYTGAPIAPVVTATAGNNSVALNWSAALPTQTGCTVYRSAAKDSGFVALASQPAAGATTYTDATAVNGTTYFYNVRTVNATATSPRSNAVSVIPKAGNTQLLYPASDIISAGCIAVGSSDGTMSVTLNEIVADAIDYVLIQAGGHLQVSLDLLTQPLAAGTTVPIDYVLGPLQTGTCIVSLYAGTTLIASDIVRSSPGAYGFTLTSAQVASITGTDVRLDLVDTSPIV